MKTFHSIVITCLLLASTNFANAEPQQASQDPDAATATPAPSPAKDKSSEAKPIDIPKTKEAIEARLEEVLAAVGEGYGRVQQSPVVQEMAISAISAIQKYENELNQHPELQEQRKAVEEAQMDILKAISEKQDEAKIDELRQKFMAAQSAQKEAGKKFPELERIRKGSEMVQQIYKQTLDETLSDMSEADARLVQERNALQKALEEIEKKAAKNKPAKSSN